DAVHLAAEGGIAEDEPPGDDTVVEDLGLVVDVAQEEVEGADTLDQPRIDGRPLVCGNDAGEEIEGKGPLGAGLVTVNGEGHPLVAEGQVGQRAPTAELHRR